jgi:CHAT domain-containing protein/Tfp pilus assembly protein PilF
MSCGRIVAFIRRTTLVVAAASLCHATFAQNTPDPDKLLQDADRLAWLKNWTRAEPLYADAERLFTERGDQRNALYASVNELRAQLPRLSVPEVSQRLAEYLEDPIVQGDDRLRLRCLVIKGETDTDLDPFLAEQSWREALDIATKLADSAWVNRAEGELGLVAFLQGDISTSVIKLGRALQTAQSNGDLASVVRWLTLFGEGYSQLGRAEQALDYYDKALKAASLVPELQFPAMTYLGKGDALVKIGRFDEAEQLLNQALAVATREGALGYQAELTFSLGLIANGRKQTDHAVELLSRATDLARKAGGNRILAEIALDLAKIQRANNRLAEADDTLREGVDVARTMHEQILTPKLLAQLAEVRSSQQRYMDAADLLEEATDLLEGLLTRVSSPWVQSRVIAGMDDVFVARTRLEGARGHDANRLFSVVEQTRGRSLLELLVSAPLGDLKKPPELRAGERQIAALQLQLYRAKGRADRQRLLDQIFSAEERLAPVETELFNSTRINPRKAVTLKDLQAVLRSDEVVLEFALAEPASYCVVATRAAARICELPGRTAIQALLRPLLQKVRTGEESRAEAQALGAAIFDRVPEISRKGRLIVSPDGDLHQLPFELLLDPSGKRLLDTHVVSYIPSGSVLTILRSRQSQGQPHRVALAVSASQSAEKALQSNGSAQLPLGAISRGVYDLDGAALSPLPSADDEARSVAATLGGPGTTVLLGDSATERALKQQPLGEYRVIHFAVHGIVSTKYPARSALILLPGGGEDGLLQAREILSLRLRAALVTLSACDTGAGGLYGQEGVSSLVRPFLAAGARTVVANLWSADDTFSLAIMREFYRQLATGADKGEALRKAKLTMITRFGPQAVPKLWSGLLMYGDSVGAVIKPRRAATN